MSVTLVSGAARACLLPELGAGLASLDWDGQAILRPWSGQVGDGPFALGMNLLAPFSNRISAPFAWEGDTLDVPANLPGEPFAIHGDAFQRAWTVEAQDGTSARLWTNGAIGPWRHDCVLTCRLGARAFDCTLTMTNRADRALPYGGGFHPWFPRSAGTRLKFSAGGYWPEDARHLPATAAAVALPPGLDWSEPAPLPAGWINAGFGGWDGRATILQPGLRLAVAATGCDTAIIYSPGADSGFFCFEPVSHPVDAHNLPDRPGLVRLAPGESLTLSMSLAWDAT